MRLFRWLAGRFEAPALPVQGCHNCRFGTAYRVGVDCSAGMVMIDGIGCGNAASPLTGRGREPADWCAKWEGHQMPGVD